MTADTVARWLYGIAVVALVVVAWIRIGEWDRVNDELERRRQHW